MDILLPREKKTIETKRRIVDAAGKLIRQYDFRYLTVKNVCEEAGVAYGSFYHHFGTKENVIHEYCAELFEKMLEANPTPSEVGEGDFVREVIWSLLVYAKFCELMGKDIIRYIYQNCPDDMFYGKYFEPLVRKVIRRAYDLGYVSVPLPDRLDYISEDVAVVYKGLVMCWFNDFHLESHGNRLPIGMEHIIRQVLSTFRNEKYYGKFGGKLAMVTDDENFDKYFTVIPELQ